MDFLPLKIFKFGGIVKERNVGLDHIRILLTVLVVLHHIAIAYGGSGGWYWREEPNASNPWLVAFNTINQSFFMGFFFLLAGYYSAMSLGSKGSSIFLKERFVRLGLPLLVYFFLLHPIAAGLASAENLAEIWPNMVRHWEHFELEVGPLWFAEALLIFSLLLVVVRRLSSADTNRKRQFPGFLKLLIVALALGLISFALRLVIPVGVNVLWLQLAYFPCYVFLFFAGVAAWPGQLLENLSSRQIRPWIFVTVTCLTILPFAFSGVFGQGSFSGGMNLNALFYAMWDPLIGFGIIMLMLWCFQTWFYRASVFSDFLARRAYAVFIIHPPVVVASCLLFEGIAISPVAKFLVVGGLSLVTCVLIGTLLLLVPGIRKVI